MDYRILGSLEVRRDGESVPLGGHRQRAVLAVLALSANHTLHTDALIDKVWSGAPPRSATVTLQSYISDLRRLLEPDRAPRAAARVVVSRPGGYLLAVPEGALDLDRFHHHTAEARAALTSGDPLGAGRAARQALGEFRGPALADFADEPFAAADIRRLEEARLQTLELRIDADLAAGRHGDVVAELGALVAEHPLRERLRGQLMLALYRAGRQADALDVARRGRERLAEDLGIDPDPELRALEEAILRQDPALTAVSARPVEVVAPPRQAAPTSAAPADPQHAGMIGRDEERAVLSRALAAARGRSGRVLLIGGEPGIGKTRLAEAFAADVDGARVLWGHCHEAEGAPPFWPWRQVLRGLAADLDASTLRAALGHDAGVVVDVAPELAERVGEVAPVRLPDAGAARFHFFDAVTRLLTETARSRPTVVVLEDLHWADESSMSLLRFIAPAVRGSGLLVVATYRDVAVTDGALLATTLGALAREPVVERLLLPGLTGEEGTALVTRLLGYVPDGRLVADILERTGGNPLFMIHLTGLLRGVGDPEDARAVVREQVPPAVTDLIGLRVAEQPEMTRRLLEVAAVVGRGFELDLLVEVDGSSHGEALAAVLPAVAAGLVVEDPVGGAYRFTHALMREAILAGLGRSRAGHVHGLVGDALAARSSDPRFLPAVAQHYWQAAKVGWADAALETATRAAAAAIAGLAYEDAQRHLDRALQLLEVRPAGEATDRVELDVRLQLATHLMRTRGYAATEVGEACRRARLLAARLDARAELLVAGWGLAAHHLVRSEHRAAVAIGDELLATAELTGNPVAALAGHQSTGVPSFYLGRHADAARHLEVALDTARSLPSEVLARFPQSVEVGAMAFLAVARWLLGQEQEGELLRLRALGEARRLGGYDEVFALMVSAQLGVLRRAPAQVLADTGQMLDRCGEGGFRHLAAHARVMHGWALALDGQPADGIPLIEQGMSHFAVHERSTRRLHNLTLLAEALALGGRTAEAEAAISAAVEELDMTEERFFEPEMWVLRARLLGGGAGARECLSRAVAAAEAAGAVPLRDRALAAAAGEVRPGPAVREEGPRQPA